MRVWDRRQLARPLHHFTVHVKPTMRLEWSPMHAGKAHLAQIAQRKLVLELFLHCLDDKLTDGGAAAATALLPAWVPHARAWLHSVKLMEPFVAFLNSPHSKQTVPSACYLCCQGKHGSTIWRLHHWHNSGPAPCRRAGKRRRGPPHLRVGPESHRRRGRGRQQAAHLHALRPPWRRTCPGWPLHALERLAQR